MHCAVEKMSLQTDKVLVLDISCVIVLPQDPGGGGVTWIVLNLGLLPLIRGERLLYL